MAKKTVGHLNNAPIVEAVLDLRVELDPKTRIEDLESAYESFKGDKFIKADIHRVSYEGVVAPEDSSQNRQTITDDIRGFRFISEDGRHHVQYRLDGFSFNHLHPYSSWEELFSEAWKYWQIYISIANPIAVKRVALRYINKCEFPERDLSRYVERSPGFSDDVPGRVSAFFFQSVIKIAENISATVAQLTEPEGAKPGLSYVLDIDVSRNGDIPVPSNEQLETYFQELRRIKNEVFFNTVTQEAIDLWK